MVNKKDNDESSSEVILSTSSKEKLKYENSSNNTKVLDSNNALSGKSESIKQVVLLSTTFYRWPIIMFYSLALAANGL